MTRKQFQDHCDDVSTEERNENWESAATLRNIAKEIGIVTLEFSTDTEEVFGV